MPSFKSNLIAFVSNNSWSVYNFRLGIIHWLQQRGYRVLVIAPEDEFSQLLKQEGCLFEPVPFNNRIASPWSDYRLFRRLKKLYAAHAPAFIFHYVAKPNIYGTLAAGSLGLPSVAVVTGLGYAFDKNNWLRFLVKGLYAFALRSARQVWFLNEEDASVFRKQNLAAAAKIRILPGEGVDTGYFKPPIEKKTGEKAAFVFLMSCRLLKSKGVALFAEASAILRKKSYLFQCRLIGAFEPSHPDSVTGQDLRRWQDAGLILYDGFARDVRPWLESADCCVLPSYYHEGVPRSLMEAASMELPLITSRTPGCKAVVEDGVTGLLCHLKDAEDLAEKMEAILRMPLTERLDMGRMGRRLMVGKFDLEQVKGFYKEALAGADLW